MAAYNSLEQVLDGWFGCSFAELPNPLKRRVIADFHHFKWDELSPDQRRSLARQHDYERDPATADHREFWFNFYAGLHDLDREIEKWERVSAPTALDLKQKEVELQSLRDKKAHHLRLRDMFLERRFPRIMNDSETAIDGNEEETYLALPAALERLKVRLDTNIEEIAAWVFMGPDEGGLRAFTKPRHRSEVSRFWFEPEMDPDYEALLFNCWFSAAEIDGFKPGERFMAGKRLIVRWEDSLGEKTKDFIVAKVVAGELTDLHPVKGATAATDSESNDFPAMETGLFSMGEIEEIEQEQGIEYTGESLFREKNDQESAKQRRDRIEQWIQAETKLRGERGAIKRVADREGISRQRISQILSQKPE